MDNPPSRVALLVPTYRKTAQILANLSYLAAFSGPDIQIVFSDSSTDPGKHHYLSDLKARHAHVDVILREQRIPLYRDVVAVLEQTSACRYVAICADDDYMSLDYLMRSVEMLEKDPAVVCAYGNYLIWQQDRGIAVDPRNALDASPTARLQHGFNPSAFNTLFFSVCRRSAMQPWVDFSKGHPMIGAFFDALHACSMFAQGQVRCHGKGFYLWTGENWDTQEKNFRSRARYYNDAGLPDAFTVFHDLHFAVEGMHFFLSKHSPVSGEGTRKACAQILWSRCMERFRRTMPAYEKTYLAPISHSAKAREGFTALIKQESCDEPRIIDWFCSIVAAFSEEHAQRYAAQIRANLDAAAS